MRKIDLNTWPRRKHFEVYNALDYPHFSLCAPVDLRRFYPAVKDRGLSFMISTVYVLTRAANAQPEFRYRIRNGEVIEHPVVHPSPTIPSTDDLFSFCTMTYTETFTNFAAHAADRIAQVAANLELEDEPGQDNLLFMTSIPWVAFTNISHPIHIHPADSVPRIAWGRYTQTNDSFTMPLSVQAHHGLLDGLHLGRYYQAVQALLDEPEIWMD